MDEEPRNNTAVDCEFPENPAETQRKVTHRTTSYGISIDSTRIRSVPLEEQAAVLQELGIDVFNQEDFEEGVLKQVDEAIAIKETEEVVKCWEREVKAVHEDIRNTEQELCQIGKILQGSGSGNYSDWQRMSAVKRQQENKIRQLKKLQAKQKSLHHKLGIGEAGEDIGLEGSTVNKPSTQFQEDNDDDRRSEDGAEVVDQQEDLQIAAAMETERERLIKTGQMTPFGSVLLQDAAQNEMGIQTTPRVWAENDLLPATSELCSSSTIPISSQQEGTPLESDSDDEYVPDADELKESWHERQDTSHKREGSGVGSKKRKKTRLNVRYHDDTQNESSTRKIKRPRDAMVRKATDDGNEGLFRQRIRELRIRELMKKKGFGSCDDGDADEEDFPDVEFDQGLKIPGKIWHKLYKYQQTGVKWLWELHCQQAGGIVGDEMGLGKTIQMISFLAGLKYSNISARKSSKRAGLGPVLIVCPVTILHQWVSEFHKWCPEFRVAVLHDTGSYQGPRKSLIKNICDCSGVLVTSYSGVRAHQDELLASRFDYVILDEGHKIRNPDAEITLTCKQFRTCHRLILSGSPMQNNLKELWSLFDFVFPGKLGTLPVFMAEFSVPITMGGYANASDIQVHTAYKCATVLRDTINPYMLRRMKKDVRTSIDIPSKSEQVLFCRLSDEQRELYQQYLDSREVQLILAGNFKVFPGLIMLRKICNHPDLTSEAGSLVKAKQDALEAELGLTKDDDPAEGYGDWRRAGKMIVLEALLKMWKFQGHRVLLFSQTRQMLNILEMFVTSQNYTYRRMDGSTSVASRQPLIKKFNEDASIFVFLLTTRVGGLGVNLVGANRVIIYDPDWNPSTDTQARERAWRIGQKRNVTVYRLLTTGTIEEKIYHRQIFKQFLTNRVLKDPKQRRFFKTNDLYELFTLTDTSDKKQGTETSAIFAGTNCEVKVRATKKKSKKEKKERSNDRVDSRKLIKLGSMRGKENGKGKKRRVERPGTTIGTSSDAAAFSVDARDRIELTQRLLRGEETNKTTGEETNKADGAGTTKATDEKTTKSTDEETTSATGGTTTKATSEETIKAPGEDTTKSTGEKTTRASGENTAKATGEKTAKSTDTTRASGEETTKATGENTTRASGEETTKATGENTTRATGEKTTKANGEETTKATGEAGGANDGLVAGTVAQEVVESLHVLSSAKPRATAACHAGSIVETSERVASAFSLNSDSILHRETALSREGQTHCVFTCAEAGLNPFPAKMKPCASDANSDLNRSKPTKKDTEKSMALNSDVLVNRVIKQKARLHSKTGKRGGLPEAWLESAPSHGRLMSRSAVSRDKSRKTRKRKLSNMSDEELEKKLRIKQKKKKRRRAKFEGQTVDHLDYHEIFSPVGSGAEDLEQDEKQSSNQDELILKTLFSRTGVHSALQHDVIMDSGDPDYTLVEIEANRVAMQAAQALKQSRQRCMSATSGIPTWTGASGASGLLSSSPTPQRPRFGKHSAVAQPKPPAREEHKPLFSGDAMGMSSANSEQSAPVHSSDLLAKMRARNNVVVGDVQAEGVQLPKTECDDLLVEIRNFIAFKASVVGSASTQEIVDAFGSKLPLTDSAVFRSLLRQICTFVRNQVTKTGIWKLKPEFS